MNLQERIAEVMAETGWQVGQIAEIAGISSSAVSQWKDGPTQSIKIEPASKLAQRCNFSAMWLATGKGPKRPAVPPGDDILEPEFAGRPRAYKHIPIIGTAKLGTDGFYEELSPYEGGGDGFIEMATQDPQAYGLRVRGQSMFPSIRDGWFVLIEPNGQLRTGEYVLIKLKDGRKMVKELLFNRSSSIEVMSVNGGERMTFDFPDIESTHAVAAVVPPSKWNPT